MMTRRLSTVMTPIILSMFNSSMSYTVFKRTILLFLLIYAIVGVGVEISYGGGKKIYPFFSWFLFSHTPARIETGFDAVIIRAGEVVYDPPILFAQAKDVYDLSYNSMPYYNDIIRQLAVVSRGNNTLEVLRLRQELEANFLVSPVVYEMVEITFEPQKRWQSGEVLTSKPIQRFEFTDHEKIYP